MRQFVGIRFLTAAVFLVLLSGSTAAAQLVSSSRMVSYPAHGFWNGFNSHFNVVECINAGSPEVIANLSVFGSAGTLLGAAPLRVSSWGTVHFSLNTFPIANDYGLYRLTIDPASVGGGEFLRCTTVIYRFAEAGALIPLTYAYALPAIDPQSGVVWGYFNSFNPDGASEPSQNWLSIANVGTQNLSAVVQTFDAAGAPLDQFSIDSLGPNRRFDVALGHPSGQRVGLYRITPSNSAAPYFAFNTIYGIRNNQPYSSYPLYSSKSGCPTEPVFVSTIGPANNWAQVANTGPAPIEIDLTYRANTGTELGSESRTLAPRSQQHILLNTVFGDNNIGTLAVSCQGGTSAPLLLQNTFYLRNPFGLIGWAYASQQRGMLAGAGELAVAPVNSYLGALSWMRNIEGTFTQARIAARVNIFGVLEALSSAVGLLPNATVDVPVFTLFPPDNAGTLAAEIKPSGLSQTMELLRVFTAADGRVSGVVNLPAQIVPGTVAQVSLIPVAVGLNTPIGLSNAGDNSNRLFVIELGGRIRAISPTGVVTTFLDISDRVRAEGEQGLLGLAFHPNFESNGRFFVYYIALDGTSTISEFSSLSNPNDADENSERLVITIEQPPFSNHKGGTILFGPDGMLYFGLGDGGSAGDPGNRAQNPALLLGKLSRIDVNGAQPYAIPNDNPFVGVSGFRPEIWAIGFRNPFRFSFDAATGRLFLGDVGQNAREEIDIVVKGANYGWRIMEGTQCFNPATNCPQAGLSLPIHDYGRDQGVSVTGGYVYRGDSSSSAFGKYIFGDFGSRRIWTLEELADGGWARTEIGNTGAALASFGEGEDGRLFAVTLDGRVSRLHLP